MPGGLGGGIKSQGVPTISLLVNHFAKKYETEVYMFSKADESYSPSGFKLHTPPDWISFSLLRWLFLIFIFVFSHFKKKHSTIISFWGYPSGFIVTLISKIFFKPSIILILGGETANVPEINYGLLRKPLLRKIILWTCAACTKLIAVSKYQVEQLRRYNFKREALIIPWGAERSFFKEKIKELSQPLKIIHVANLNAVKDQPTLIKAFSTICKKTEAKLRIVGPDYLNGKIQALVAEMNLNNEIEFTGGVPYEMIPKHLAWADLFILTSLSEAQNNSITEAMACGLLCASTSVGIMYDLGNDFGIVVDTGDYRALANKIITVASDPNLWKAKVESSLAWSKTHDFSWTISELDKCISSVINS